MSYNIRNSDLTQEALEYIFKNGRNTFDKMINDLIKQGKNIYKEGWIIRKRRNKK
jgi:hypothetical protein